MSNVKRIIRMSVPALASLLAIVALAPAAANARMRPAISETYGATSLVLDPATVTALTGLGVTPGVIAPAYASGGALDFPIVSSPVQALTSLTIKHSGGISLTAGATTVKLTDFWIQLAQGELTAVVNGGSRVPILSLEFSGARLGLSSGLLTVGPVTGLLTSQAASALDAAFKTSAIPAGLELGVATVEFEL